MIGENEILIGLRWHGGRSEVFNFQLFSFAIPVQKNKQSRSSDKKTPAELVLADCLEPSVTRRGPCWSFRRFGLTDAAHRSKEGSPFVSVDSESIYQSSRPQGNLFIVETRVPYPVLNYTLIHMRL